jgi:cytochrome c oxidase assembly protein subunit 15
MNTSLHRLAAIAAVVTFCVIVLGAFVRLSDAGLGCPDWPGCYGQLSWPSASEEIAAASEAFPERPVETAKAWKEMVHRYLAGVLVLLVVAINVVAWKLHDRHNSFRLFAALLLALIVFQAALGMWTVTLKLWPIVVMGHLLGGLATFSLLLWLAFRTGVAVHYTPVIPLRRLRGWIIGGLLVLCLQIALGGWTSANYSALACPDLPTCQGQWWPQTNFSDGFVLWREIGVDYEGGVLDLPSRTAIHMMHRIGAVATFIMICVLAFRLMRVPVTQRSAILLFTAVSAQMALGLLNVALYLPLPNAVAHNGMAALLLALLVWLLHRSMPRFG